MQIRNHLLAGETDIAFIPAAGTGGRLTEGAPRFLVVHYTAGGTASGAIEWFRDPRSKASAHLVIDRDGTTTQMVRFDTVAWHAGESRWRNVSGLNRHSVGIELVNWGRLKRASAGGWVSATGAPVPREQVILASHRTTPQRLDGWEIFGEAQMRAAIAAARAIVREYDIGLVDIVGHDVISEPRKLDPGPAFDMEAFRTAVFGIGGSHAGERFRVRAPRGLNLRAKPSMSGRIIRCIPDGTSVRVIDCMETWWLVGEELFGGRLDRIGFAHSRWLEPA